MILSKNFIKKNYKKLDEYIAGLILKGWEVKSIKKKNLNIKNSFIVLKNKEIYIKNMYIYNKNFKKAKRNIKLLLNKNEIIKIINIKYNKKIKIIPTYIVLIKNLIKLKFILILNEKVL